jgi:hypothetical protein
MRPTDDIKRFIDKAAVSTNPQADQTVLDTVLRAQEETRDRDSAARRPGLGSIVMSSPITKPGAAAALVVALVLSVSLWNRSVPSAYAVEQTIEATRDVRYLHIKNFTTGHEEPREGWIEFGEDGQPRKARAHMPEWASPVDGAWVLAWQDGTVQRWIKRQNRLEITKADSLREQLNATLQELDPRLVLARIAELRQQGKVETAVVEPPDNTQPITMTVTYRPDSDSPGRRQVLSIDPATKLINVIKVYQLKEDEYRRENRIELQEYNQPIDPKMFDLTNEVPANAERLDLGGVDLGLVQGTRRDEEVATAVVRQFFESIQAGDYEAAGRLVPVGGAAGLREQFAGIKILGIVSLGPATPIAGPGNKELAVPCTIEYEQDGRKSSVTLQGMRVQELPNRPGRWLIQTLGN